MRLRLLEQAPVKKGTRVILRVDFDVSFKKGIITDDFRIRDALPTIHYLLKKGAAVRIITHWHRPRGYTASLTVRPLAKYLQRLLQRKIVFIADPFDAVSFKKYDSARDVLFFENIRFWPGEEKNNKLFASELSRWGDIYVNEAFANAHRKHASMVALAQILSSFAGLHFAKEVTYFEQALVQKSKRRLVLILGGAKLETKLPLLRNFLNLGAEVIVGGVLANTIMHLQEKNIGKSVVDKTVKKIPGFISSHEGKLHLPRDAKVANGFNSRFRLSALDDIKDGEIICDIGPRAIADFVLILQQARTIIWNGPLGFAEIPQFAQGTYALASALKNIKALKIVGGGDTVAVLDQAGLLKSFTHVSSGGGAMLEFLAGEKLPGVEVLKATRYQYTNAYE